MTARPDAQRDRAQAEAGSETGRRAIGQAVAEVTAAGHQVADAGARTAQAATETSLDTARRATDATAGFVTSLSEQMRRVVDVGTPEARESLERASRDLRVVARCGTVMAERAQPIVQEILSYSQQSTQAQLEAFGRLSRARSPMDLIAAQSELVRTEMELWVRSGRRLGELMLQMGEQAEQLIEEERHTGPGNGRRGAAAE
ncbi:MAG TPA: phasin family protein [Azospirillaceae bacterium]|nr:phasin family protein [Azospirillaceae bacterium]